MSDIRQAVKQYLDAISAVSRVGTPELSHYTALDNLFDAVGDELTPKVRAVVHYSETNPGQPDLGFFSGESTDPDRGVVEVKGADADLDALIASEQVEQYWQARKLVLVTNLREFALVGQDNGGAMATLERYSLADSVAGFDELLQHTTRAANRHGVSLGEYLLRVMSHRSTISEPRDLARLLASYARDALQRVEQAAEEEDSLATIREAIEQALGMSFESEDGGRFFRSTLVQTLFYGVFAAWVLWARAGKPGRFGWKDTVYELRAPVLRMLFHQITDPGRLERLGLDEVLDWVEAALERVDREAFLKSFSEGEAVQYFYEPFLEAFDPELRKSLGVWYTPREIVRYMVARVDRALRDDLGIAKGLADERVYVLDPCCGTGAFLVETLRRIAETEQASGGATWAESVRQAAATRVFGFEIMPAPLVVSHLEIGLALERLGAGLSPNQRAGVFLTNALTGWEPHTTKPLPFPELEQERRSANQVKQQRPILVVLGNPPYNGFPGVPDVPEERALSDAYRTVKQPVSGPDVPKPQGQGLNDLYVRFFRMAERRIAEKTGKGIVCFISNYSWLDGLSFPGMRQRYLDAFDIIRIDNLNGDKYRTGKLTPEGDSDPSVFSTKDDPVGIQVGTAIATLVRKEKHKSPERVDWRELWGTGKLRELDEDANPDPSEQYRHLRPMKGLGLPFAPIAVSENWFDWPTLVSLFPAYYPGVKTSRDSLVVGLDLEQLKEQVGNHVETTDSDFVRFAYRPFDVRWLYWSSTSSLLDRPRPEYQPHVFAGNMAIVSQQKPRREWSPAQVISPIGCLDLFDRGATCIPLYLRDDQFGEEVDGVKRTANLSERARASIESMDATPEDLFHHVLATLHDPAYREANAGGLRMGWPRIPLPDDPAELAQSAARGHRLARLLDTESDVADLLADNTHIAVPTTVDGLPMQPADFHLTAGWGHFGANKAVMPGQGKIERRGDLVDVYLNDNAYWRDIPIEVWSYRLGGYQVLKKWLSYRESKVLDRGLEVSEVGWFSEVARRVAVLLGVQEASRE
ncbi:MAG: N-6 DNA methylase [Chloroflexi bacterium]|nr:N-6 DNA methylase [Chloroflexota bacterium]MYJ91797.1 N-6 DNA methylase [Chloroflexota bacterium]